MPEATLNSDFESPARGDLSFAPADIWTSADSCLKNARAFINADMIEPAQGYALGILAQEEIAKAFLLYLVYYEAIPWNQFVRRSLSDHKCKQVWFVVIDALVRDLEIQKSRLNDSRDVDSNGHLLERIADVLNWYRWAKIQGWEQGHCDWEEMPTDKMARAIVKGNLDRSKQRALYVEIGENGKVTSRPESTSQVEADEAMKTARSFYDYVSNLPALRSEYTWNQIQWLKSLLTQLFEPQVRTGKEDNDLIPGVHIYEVSRVVLRPTKEGKDC